MTRTLLAAAVLASFPALADLPAVGSAESYFRTIRAARRDGPILLDGRLDEPAWQAAELGDRFTQASPDDGMPASVQTRFRVLWDDDAIYLGVECDDPEPITATLSRRDRFVEGDWITFDFDTTNDRRTAYHFGVYAGGQQIDGLHFNDTDMTTDWDAVWESAVARTDRGWSVEVRIPLRILRIPVGASGFGFNLYRNLARRHEEDQWRYRPRGTPGDISQLGELVGLDGIHPVRSLELRPYLAARSTMMRPAPGPVAAPFQLAACPSAGFSERGLAAGCLGLDLRYALASDLHLVATVNPDFGQVEADQRVLNLSTFETFFPEKRPFFTEGLDLFQSPVKINFGGNYGGDAYQVFYSRRIGRPPPEWDDDNGTLLYQPSAQPVGAAQKLSGTVAGASLGLLSAFEPRVFAQAIQNGRVGDVRVAEAVQSEVVRVRMPLTPRALLGFFGTGRDPLFAQADPLHDRQWRHAHVAGGDFVTFDARRDWTFSAQATGSLISGGDKRIEPDGTVLHDGSSGAAGVMKISKDAGPLIGFAAADWLSPQFTVNDLGFMRRANLFRAFGYLQLRDVRPNEWRQRAYVGIWGREVRDSALTLTLQHDFGVESQVWLNSQWNAYLYATYATAAVDDRELGDGTPLERQRSWGGGGNFNSDSRKPLSFGSFFDYSRGAPLFELAWDVGGYVTLRPLSQLEATLDLAYNKNDGTIRQIRKATDPAGDASEVLDGDVATQRRRLYLLAPQHSRSISATLRGTYAFTPHLTLQLYTQLFGAGVAYDGVLRAIADPGKHTVRFSDLSADQPDVNLTNTDDRQGGLNVNLILRWEWRLGSTLYLVYAHQSSTDFEPLPHRGLDLGRELGAFTSSAATHGDTFLVKIDFFHAL